MNGNEDSTAACPQASLLSVMDKLHSTKSMAQLVVMAASNIGEYEKMNAVAWLGDALETSVGEVMGMIDELRRAAGEVAS